MRVFVRDVRHRAGQSPDMETCKVKSTGKTGEKNKLDSSRRGADAQSRQMSEGCTAGTHGKEDIFIDDYQ